MPKLSIVTATYNRAHVLCRNMESILKQTFHDLEHIIVDNMSNDGTEELVKDYQKKAPYPVIYIREPDNGIYNAMNKGIKKAGGEWIHTLNSDDRYFDSSALQEVFKNDMKDYDIIAAILVYDDPSEKEENNWRIPSFDKRFNYHNFFHPATMLKKAFLEKYGYYNENFKIMSEKIFNAQYYCKGKYIIVKQPLVYMTVDGISAKRSFLQYREQVIYVFRYHPSPSFFRKTQVFFYLTNMFISKNIPIYGKIYYRWQRLKKELKDVIRKWKGLLDKKSIDYSIENEQDLNYKDYLKIQLTRSKSKYKASFSEESDKKRKEYLINLLSSKVTLKNLNKSLVIGCRNSYELDLLKNKGIQEVVGIDLFSYDKRIKVMDMHNLKFENDTFELIYCSHTLEHAFDYKKVISEMLRVSRDNGIIVIEVPVNYEITKADIHDFKSADNLLNIFSDFTKIENVYLKEDIEKDNETNFSEIPISRVIIRIKK